MLYDVNSPLVDEYLAIFPDLTREAAAGSLNDIGATLSEGNEPAPVSAENQEQLVPLYEKIKADIEADREGGEEESSEEGTEEVPAEESAN